MLIIDKIFFMKVAFVDIDNTLLDFDAYVRHSLENGFTEFGIIKYESYMYDLFHTINNRLWQGLEKGEVTFDYIKANRFNLLFKELGVQFDGTVFESYFRKGIHESTIVIPGAEEMLRGLSKEYILCSASNGPYDQQVYRLQKAGLSKYFSYNFISEKVGYNKPSKEFFDCAFKDIGSSVLPSDCVMIGDSLSSDMEGGKNYGMKTVFYSHRKEIVSDSRIDYFVTDLKDVCRVLGLEK